MNEEEFRAFPIGRHDDRIDAYAYAFNYLFPIKRPWWSIRRPFAVALVIAVMILLAALK